MINSPLMTVMVDAVRKAARGLKRDFGEIENLQVSRKGPGNFVSAADKKAEEVLRDALMKARPGYGLIMEESGNIEGSDKSHTWHVDPLDGTTNFLHGIPHFAISIALERAGQLIAGVILNPATDELFIAEKGGGAFLNNRRLRVSSRVALGDALIGTGMLYRGRGEAADHEQFLGQLRRVMGATAGVRRMGAAALDLAYVAAGRFDGFWEMSLNPWDIAAGIVLVREAGGMVSDLVGPGDPLHTGHVLAANVALHDGLRSLIAGPG
jgi:myo-inositol-1(or 4)-monophosphatase